MVVWLDARAHGRWRARRSPGATYASMPMIGLSLAFFAFSWNSHAACRLP